MELEELPEEMKEMVEGLKDGSATIEVSVMDALEIASDVDDFRERVNCELDSLVSEVQMVRDILGKESVHVVIHLSGRELKGLAVHKKVTKANNDYNSRTVNHDEEIVLIAEAEVVE